MKGSFGNLDKYLLWAYFEEKKILTAPLTPNVLHWKDIVILYHKLIILIFFNRKLNFKLNIRLNLNILRFNKHS